MTIMTTGSHLIRSLDQELAQVLSPRIYVLSDYLIAPSAMRGGPMGRTT